LIFKTETRSYFVQKKIRCNGISIIVKDLMHEGWLFISYKQYLTTKDTAAKMRMPTRPAGEAFFNISENQYKFNDNPAETHVIRTQ
jgi:hypothetical protein